MKTLSSDLSCLHEVKKLSLSHMGAFVWTFLESDINGQAHKSKIHTSIIFKEKRLLEQFIISLSKLEKLQQTKK